MKENMQTESLPFHPSMEKTPLIETSHLGKRFGSIIALEDAQLKCYQGETHVLIGENGAGKSTMVKIICGVTKRDTGDIYMNGGKIEINSAQDANRHKIAAVFQELSLIQNLSVAENIFLGSEPVNRLGRIHFKQIYQTAQAFLTQIGLDLNSRVLVRDLTLCQQQLVEIAKALYKNPDVLILDEATSALDNDTEGAIMDSINRLHGKKTLVIIAHRLQTIEKCDAVYRVEEGKIRRERSGKEPCVRE